MVRIASFNVENLFARANAFDTTDWNAGKPVLDAYRDVNTLIMKQNYSAADKTKIRNLLVKLDIYYVNSHGAIRRKDTKSPKWAWLRKNRGTFDHQPQDPTKNVEITASKRGDWI